MDDVSLELWSRDPRACEKGEGVSGSAVRPALLLPRHVAIIPDGNRRWARRRGLSSEAGHRHGFLCTTPKLLRDAWSHGIHTITLWLFSSENWTRSDGEVDYLMVIYSEFMGRMAELCLELDCRMVHLGRADRVPEFLRKAMQEAIEQTSGCSSRVFNFALDYGGRDEIARAFGRLLSRTEGVSLDECALDEVLDEVMDTHGQMYPDPDLIVRTSGECRMSGFMAWQAAYSELFFVDVCFPDLAWEDVRDVVLEFQGRNRTRGGDSKAS